MNNILTYCHFLEDKQIAGIEIFSSSENLMIYNLVIIKKERSKLFIKAEYHDIASSETLIKYLPKGIPVCLVLTGKGTLHRKLESRGNENDMVIMNKVLPNVSMNEFYVVRTQINDEEELIAMTRKTYIEKIVNELLNLGIHLVDLKIGPGCMVSVIPLLSQELDEIRSAHYRILKNNSQILDIIPVNDDDVPSDTIIIGDDSINTTSLSAFCSCLQYLAVGKNRSSSDILPIRNSFIEHLHFKAVRLMGWGLLILLFSTLLLNYLLYEHYSKKYQELFLEVAEYNDLIEKYKSLDKELKEKKELLEELGMLKPSRVSLYADRIAAGLMDGIKLTSLGINPLIEKSALTQTLDFANNTIDITGIAYKSTILNDWMKILKKYDWVKEIDGFHYGIDIENNNQSCFELKMTVY